jgi:hypothetical protein
MIPIPIPVLRLYNLTTLLKYGLCIIFMFMGVVGGYLAWFDNAPIITFGSRGYVERRQEYFLIHIDAVRQRDCSVTIKQYVTGCGVGELAPISINGSVGKFLPPISIAVNEVSLLDPNICVTWSVSKGFCNSIQRFLDKPIRSESGLILFKP